jgi:hypothetical protein
LKHAAKGYEFWPLNQDLGFRILKTVRGPSVPYAPPQALHDPRPINDGYCHRVEGYAKFLAGNSNGGNQVEGSKVAGRFLRYWGAFRVGLRDWCSRLEGVVKAFVAICR